MVGRQTKSVSRRGGGAKGGGLDAGERRLGNVPLGRRRREERCRCGGSKWRKEATYSGLQGARDGPGEISPGMDYR